MYDIAVFIYPDETFQQTIGTYRTSFGIVPRVGDFIRPHHAIHGSKPCRVESVYIIPRNDEETTDAHAQIKAVAVSDTEFP